MGRGKERFFPTVQTKIQRRAHNVHWLRHGNIPFEKSIFNLYEK